MDVDVGGVRAFVAVADLGWFAAAADELGISQQAVSKRIARLEESLGAVLLRRGHTGAEPTAEGRLALPHARAVIDTVGRLRAAVDPRARPLRVEVVGTRVSTVGLLRDFHDSRESAGERDIEIVTSGGLGSAVPALLAGQIDAAYARVAGLDEPDLVSTPAYLEPAHVVVGPAHRFAGRTHLTPADLAGTTAWMPGNRPGTEWAGYWDEFAARFGVTIDIERPFFGLDHQFEEIAGSPELMSFVGEGTPTHVPWQTGIVRLPVVDPVPVYPLSLLWSRDSRHPLLAQLLVHTRRRFRVPTGPLWLPDADRLTAPGRSSP